MSCKHQRRRDGRDRCYSGSVATRGVTDENPMAAGGITFTQTCVNCGAEREVNANQGHREYSAWYRAEREGES